MRETLPRSPQILTSQPDNRTCHSHIYPKPEGRPIRHYKPIPRPPAHGPSHPCGSDRPCAQQGHTQRPGPVGPRPPVHKFASEGYTRGNRAPRTRGRRSINGPDTHGTRGMGVGKSKPGCMRREEEE